MQSNNRRQLSNPQVNGDSNRRTASRPASFKLGKKGTAGNPAASWIPNIRREGTYDSRPSKSIRQQMPETFQTLEPEQGSRILISGLPKDITSQDLEDLMTSMIGPTREVYIIHQYAGPPLYKQSNATSSGLERDPNAEFAENIRSLSSTGCGMVHFQREKDALEAWEQYNGKLLDGNRKVLRVQIVVDADESWLNPAERPSDSSPWPQDDAMMDTEPIEAPSANLRVTEPKSELVTSSRGPSKATMSKTTGHVTSSRTQPMAPMSTVKQTNAKPSSKSVSALPLLDRIGSPAAATSDLKNRGSITLGGHSIFLDGSATGYSAVQTIPVHASGLPPKGRVKKGPRRLAKLEAHRQQRFDQPNLPSVYPMQPITNVGQPARPRAADLDAEMEEYRRSGLMGLGPGR